MQEITTKESTSSIDVIRQGRIDKAQNLREQGINPYPYKFEKTASARQAVYDGVDKIISQVATI